ncbi:acyl-CoA dehydrogenase family protein [Paractinoplanes atraurantiacus]|uniref:Acyl-CoA dehydrogenase n=1 Tax=Paractinoplanes atraurantiacus TaxID=1036182 RepID=A0A285K3T9_9ACTN|nr:acyl-CoA dehydrogenase family protein [Actinoplanes atraurantiacus]SNY66677.1 hypothetical protein SAMN05421748_13094 [Actinoplanes atraurantiacus]
MINPPHLPLPGHGATAERLRLLADLGRHDLVEARLGEGHADAVAIRVELGDLGKPETPPGERWGVWAAAPSSVRAEHTPGGWRLTGDRPWCSGAAWCTDALVTAVADDGIRLFAVRNEPPHARPVDGTWPAIGMAGSDSRTIRFDAAPARPVGEPGQYVNRPGFWHGGIGVAACWYGGALGVADRLLTAPDLRPRGPGDLSAADGGSRRSADLSVADRGSRRSADLSAADGGPRGRTRLSAADLGPHGLAHLGAVDVALGAARAVLAEAAAEIDADPTRNVHRLALRVRATVEAAATQVLDHVGRALGAGPLSRDEQHARRVADLTVYLRQSHAEKDLEQLGAAILASPEEATDLASPEEATDLASPGESTDLAPPEEAEGLGRRGAATDVGRPDPGALRSASLPRLGVARGDGEPW